MEKHSIKTQWKGGMAFETDINGHKIVVDAPEAAGGANTGPGPKKLMLVALSGCTGMDVVSILKKMRVEVEACEIEVQADLTDDYPKHYSKMHVTYTITGKNLPREKVEKAVRMSEETYCGVRTVYQKVMDVTSEIKIIDSLK